MMPDATAVQQSADSVFPDGSIWRTRVPDAPLHPDSDAMIANLTAQAAHGNPHGPAMFNCYAYAVTWYPVPDDQPTTQVQFSNCQNKPRTPPGLYGPGGQFEDVPIPDDAAPAVGTDAAMTIYRPGTDQLWELWKAYRDDAGAWWACWGGRIDGVSTSPGYFPNGFGAGAAGIIGAGGNVTIADVQRGVIRHGLSLAIPAPAYWTTHVWPAQRSDGTSTDPHALPEGTRLKLPTWLNIAEFDLHPIAAMVARAAQYWGLVVNNRAGVAVVTAESGAATAAVTGVDPWDDLLGGTPPFRVLAGFPWDRLQVIDPAWRPPA